ncbi:hypothetical protein BDFB_003479 [Asbolus verrucosus]|uniref:Uncharacterized protein n=1 Tax=Asbolus verrucosus TaxID=1661398 RepID=A0A482VFC8_ASBVE|nr:hypothetical protein BDFB_003479 [Asbolus verrucosus]
MKADHSQARAR